MKDEIKEILDNFKIYEDRYKKCNETQFIIFYRDIHLLLDYITNLQEKYEEADNDRHILFEQKEKAIEYCELNKEFTPRLEDVENILNGGDDNE